MGKTFNLRFTVGHTLEKHARPKEFVAASVPGSANLDWAIAKNMPDWKYECNYTQYRWTEDCYWLYQTTLPSDALAPNHRRVLFSKGIDYEYDILVGGDCIYHHEGMFHRFELDLSGLEGDLEVLVYPVPKDPEGHAGTREEAAQCCKPAVSYSWDWHPRLIPMGIWDDFELKDVPNKRLEQVNIDYKLAADYKSVTLTYCTKDVDGAETRISIKDPSGKEVVTHHTDGEVTIANPELWWCNGYGKANLYTWTIELLENGNVIDTASGRVGFRTIKMVMNEGAWDEPQAFPKGRSVAPITIELNGVNIFAKGSNWVNPEVFVGTITRDTYKPLIDHAKQANFNIFRLWGGAIINKDSFYELCDESGIMVWQEFMLACNNYRDSAHYLEVLESEAADIINRLKNYTSVVMWCGGNELFNNWSGMTDQSLALRLLNKLTYELDPQQRPFLMTSPLFGMGHGCYLFRYPDGREVFQVMPASKMTAYTEFGVPSISNLDTCLEISAEQNLFPMVANDITIAHHAFDAWHVSDDICDTWCSVNTIRDYFGEAKDLVQLIEQSQWLQSEGYKCIYEEARRQKPYCSMAINWCYNEPWPTLANNSLINYPDKPKTSLSAVASACRPILASAQIPKFAWEQGDVFEAGIWLLNDSRDEIKAGKVEVTLSFGNADYHLLSWQYDNVSANENLIGPVVRFQLPKVAATDDGEKQMNVSPVKKRTGSAHKMTLTLEAGVYSSKYELLIYC